MAIPTFVAAGTVQSGTGGVTPGLPAGYAADDIFLLFCETADQTVSTPSGWTIAPNSPISNGFGSQLSVFYRRATASESAPAIADPGDHLIARILAFRGCIASGSPFDVSRNDIPGSTSWSMQMPTTTVADTLLVMGICCGADTTSAQFSGWTNAALTSITEQVDNFTTSGNGGGFAVATGGKATAGFIGNTTGSCVTNDDFAGWIGALKPAPPERTATLTKTLGLAVAGATGSTASAGSLAKTLGALSLVAAGATAVSASLTKTLDAATLAADGTVEPLSGSADLDVTLGALSLAADAGTSILGDADLTLGDCQAAGEGALAIQGALSVDLGAAGLTSEGQAAIGGSFVQTLAVTTLTSVAVAWIDGSLSITLDPAELESLAVRSRTGVLSVTLGGLTLTASGAVTGWGTIDPSADGWTGAAGAGGSWALVGDDAAGWSLTPPSEGQWSLRPKPADGWS